MRSLLAAVVLAGSTALAQPASDPPRQPALYVVGYAHLDTQWRWEYPQTIGEYLPHTMHDNFALFAKYPHYIFNFSGANRYRMMKEYYPDDFAKVKEAVAAGRWFPAGSSMEESDVNSPSAESIIRQVLYGNRWFRRELGRTSAEYMLPDCFGFPASLPSILAHMGIKGFSTQKLTWHSANGIPFNVGVWEGPDGRGVIAAFNPGDYSGDFTEKKLADFQKRMGEFDYMYYGTGDVGGSPREPSVKLLEETVTRNDGAVRVLSSTAEQMFLDITAEQRSRLPRYRGDLELIEHSAGSLTSQAYQKYWNRANELLADAAEKASVAATWLGARDYPQRLNDAWTLVMGGQFHDIAAGTATPKAYEYSWNDDVLAMNQFSAVLNDANEAVAAALDTRATGTPVVVYNPLSVDRQDVVEIAWPSDHARVVGPDGKDVPTQVSNGKLLFVAKVPSIGYAVYDVRAAGSERRAGSPDHRPRSPLSARRSLIENHRYRLTIDDNGDISSIFDKSLKRELLAAPARLAFQTERPHDWPAWNMDWVDQQKPPRGFVAGPATVRVVEDGAVRVAVEITRQTEGSTFVQTIRLTAGDAGNRVEIDNAIDWKSEAAALKATFELTASNPKATYNWEVGTVQRGNNEPRKFEVPTHQWLDLTDAGGAYGVTLLTGAKYGSDKPDDHTLRITLLYTPGLGDGNGRSYSDQTTQDWGHHRFVYGLAAHGSQREGTDWQALRLEQPLIAFATTKHAGSLGKRFSLLHVSNPRVRVMALKKAEDSDDVIVRMVELDGTRTAATLSAGLLRELDGQERLLTQAGRGAKQRAGSPRGSAGRAAARPYSFGPYQLRTFAIRLAPPPQTFHPPHTQPLIDGAIVPRGQTIALPSGTKRVSILAAADGDQKATFRIGDRATDLVIQDRTGAIGQWDTRLWTAKQETLPRRPDAPPAAPPRVHTAQIVTGIKPGFIKPAPVAWFTANKDYIYSYIFTYNITVPPHDTTLTLPDNDKIHIMSITAER